MLGGILCHSGCHGRPVGDSGQGDRVKHGSLFAGIGGFDLGFDRVGIETVWTVENDKSCNQVLATHWPDVERHQDVREVGRHHLAPVDIISGGFPCQDLSVAGRRTGLAGERSGLWVEFARIIEEMEAKWVVVENVPGLFSSNGGADFAIIVRTLELFGYCVAWRVLDSQFFGVPQRRRRVFIVGSLGNASSIEVLFESEGGEGHIAESREEGQRVAQTLAGGSEDCHSDISSGQQDGNVIVQALQARDYKGVGTQYVNEDKLVGAWSIRTAHTKANENNRWWYEETPPLYGAEPVAIVHEIHGGSKRKDRPEGGFYVRDMKTTKPLDTSGLNPACAQGGVAFTHSGYSNQPAWVTGDRTDAVASAGHHPSSHQGIGLISAMGVRRLTPTECERLQGFPDGWTEGLSDMQRYKMLGNAVTVNVAEWIGRRLIAT